MIKYEKIYVEKTKSLCKKEGSHENGVGEHSVSRLLGCYEPNYIEM